MMMAGAQTDHTQLQYLGVAVVGVAIYLANYSYYIYWWRIKAFESRRPRR